MTVGFRGFLDLLEKNGKLLRVKGRVSPRFEIAAAIRKASDSNGPALIFENIEGYPGWRVAGGVYATRQHLALALGLPLDASEDAIVKCYLERGEKQIKPRVVASGPVKEVIIKGRDVDLSKLPVPLASELDAGPYLTAGVEFARHSDTGLQNVSIHRRLILDKNSTTLFARGYQHLAQMIAAAEAKGQGLGVATAIGVEPALTIASQLQAPFGVDEGYLAGGLAGEPIEMVKCETIDVEVPANAEIVIEGVTVYQERAKDGPFGEYPGNYITLSGEARSEAPLVKVTAITMRKDAIFQAVLTGMPMTENHVLKKWELIADAYREAGRIAEVTAITTSDSAPLTHMTVAINKKSDDEPGIIIKALLNRLRTFRHIVVVDDDIDINKPAEIEWALNTRLQPDKGVIVLPPKPPVVAKWGIDATMPLKDKQWYQKTNTPGVEKIKYV